MKQIKQIFIHVELNQQYGTGYMYSMQICCTVSYIMLHVWAFINSCNMGTSVLADMYTRNPEGLYISDMLQLLCNTHINHSPRYTETHLTIYFFYTEIYRI